MLGQIHPKVTAATLGAAFATLVLAGFQLAGVHLSIEVQGAVTTLSVFAAGYLTSS